MTVHPDPSSADPFPGQTLSGRFVVQRVAGQTPDAITYAGIDQTTGTPVRIQRPAAFRADADVRSRLRSAGESIARAKSVPGVVVPIASGVHAGVPYLVLPVISGGTLADRLAQLKGAGGGTAAVRSMRVWLQPIAAILDSLHQRGVVHGRLTPESIGFGAGNAPVIDGVPIRQMVMAIGGDAARVSDAVTQPNVAPEVSAGVNAEAASDQYSLAAIVAECLSGGSSASGAGRRLDVTHAATDLPRTAAKALAPRPGERFASCAEFVDSLFREVESARQTPAPVAHAATGEAPLELESPETAATHTAAPRSTAPIDVPLELEEIETDAVRRSARKSKEPFDEALDITFTKVGESLLAPKSAYDRARSLAGARSAWRRMREGYGELASPQQWIARAAVAVLGVMLAVWLLQAGWRGVRYVAGAAQTAAKTVVDKVQPDVGSLKESGQQFAQKMRDLWNDIRPPDEADEHGAEPAAPSQGREERQVEGTPWPDRAQDELSSVVLRAPTALITEIMGYKGIQLTADGLGAFHVDDPGNADRPKWIGGFGMLKKPGLPRKAVLHGTVVHYDDDGATCVARYVRGGMGEFWRITDREGRPVVAYTRLKNAGTSDAFQPDGAAFVLDGFRTSCVAFSSTKGKLVGGQWCAKAKDEDGNDIYLPPGEIADVAKLDAADEAFKESHEMLESMLEKIPEFHKQAVAALKSHQQAGAESRGGGRPE